MGVADHAKAALAEKQGGNGKNKLPEKKQLKTLAGLKSDAIAGLLNAYKMQIAMAIPKHVTAERIIQLATTVITRNQDIKQCTPESVIGAVMNAAMLGLDITPQFGQAYFVPYNNNKLGVKECQFMLGYRGWIQLFRRSNEISTIYAEVVRDGDEFAVEYGLNMAISHKPNLQKRGKLIAAYAVVKYKDGGYNFAVLTEADVMARKARSRAASSGKSSPWDTDPEAMWRKSAIRALIPYVPASVEMLKAAVTDGAVITSEMFSTETKDIDLDKVPEAEVVENGNSEVLEEEPKEEEIDKGDGTDEKVNDEKPAGKKADAADPRNEFYAMARPLLEKILKTKGADYLATCMNDMGFANLEEVPQKDWSKVVDALQLEAEE